MSVLAVAVSDIKRLCGIADTSQDAVITALLTAEQPVHEYALDPGILAGAVAAGAGDGGLATLTLGVAEVLAGSFLTDLGRFPHFAEPLPLAALTPQAVTVLTVAVADIKRLIFVGALAADTSQDTPIAAIIAAEQLALEYALDPAVLAAAVSTGTPNAGLKAWLTLGIAEQIAGHYLEQSGRVPGIADDIQISSLHFTTSHGVQPDKLGQELAAQGTARLLPFSRHIRAEHQLKPVLNQPDLIKLGAALLAQGLSRLAPFLRAKRSINRQAAGLVPDADAAIPAFIASSVLPGSVAAPPMGVFAEAFSDIGDAYTESLDPHFADLDTFENEGGIYFGGPE